MSTVTSYLPLYDQVFSSSPATGSKSAPFASDLSDLERLTTKSNPDFSISDTTRADRLKRIAWIALKILILPWGLAAAANYAMQRLIMMPLFPSQSNFLKKRIQQLDPNFLNRIRAESAHFAGQNGSFVREVTLERNGVRYDGLMIGNQNSLRNGNWILQATGNACPIEAMFDSCGSIYAEAGFNVLLINGPSVGRSEGHATPRSIGEAQEIGIRFLETAVKAKRIAIAGHSLGGAAIGQAILQHEFKKDVDYLVIRQFAFDRTSNIVKKIVREAVPMLRQVAKHLIHLTDLEMDNVQASRKLQEIGIKEVIIQASTQSAKDGVVPGKETFATDGIIPATGSLGYRLVKEGVTMNKVFQCIPRADHNNGQAFIGATREALIGHFGKYVGKSRV